MEIDDFGTGHTSILGLVNLKPDFVKIDRRLTANIHTDPQARQLLKSIVDICREQGALVCIEGVETEPQFKKAGLLDCNMCQGFYLHRPSLPTFEAY